MIVKFVEGTEVVSIVETSERFHLLITLTGDWYFSYNHKIGLHTISTGKWYGPYTSKFNARKAMMLGHVKDFKLVKGDRHGR